MKDKIYNLGKTQISTRENRSPIRRYEARKWTIIVSAGSKSTQNVML